LLVGVLLVSIVGTLAGCTSLGGLGKPKDDDLYGVLKRFHHDLRWKYNEDAAARVDPRFAADFRDQLEDLTDDLSITAWDLRKADLDPATKKAAIRIQLSYYQMPSTVVRNEKIDEVWQQVEDRWLLIYWKGGPFQVPPEADDPDRAPAAEKAPAAPGGPGEVRDLPDPEPDPEADPEE
jgi:hypothetical protein